MIARVALILALVAAAFGGLAPGASAQSPVTFSQTTYTGPDGPHPMDVYQPPAEAGPGPFPGVVLIHGGGWTAGDKVEFTRFATSAAARGFVVANIDYSLASPGTPTLVGDVTAAVAGLRAQAPQYRLDPNRVATWGHSAGAHLALAAAEPAHTQAAVGWSGPYDLPRASAESPPLWLVDRAYLGCDSNIDQPCRDGPARAESPALTMTPAGPPVFTANGTNELMPADQQDELVATAQRGGVFVQALRMWGNTHGPDYQQDVLGPTLDFLDDRLGNRPPPVPYSAPVYDPLTNYWLANGGRLGGANGPPAPASGGAWQPFANATVYKGPTTNPQSVQGAIHSRYQAVGGPTAAWPTTDELGCPDGIGRFSVFTAGSIYWSPASGAWEIFGAIRDRWAQLGWERSYLGYPTSAPYAVPGGTEQRFQNGRLTAWTGGGTWDRRY